MRDFTTSFLAYFADNKEQMLRFPKAAALFQREIDGLFKGFRKYLEDKYVSHKGLTLKGFKSILSKRGFVFVSNKR